MTMQEMPSPHLHGASDSRSASRRQALASAPGSGGAGPSGASGGAGGTGASGASGGSGSGGGSAGNGGPFQHAPPAGHAKTFSAVLGEIVWLMSQSPLHTFVALPTLLRRAGRKRWRSRPAAGSRNESRRAQSKPAPALLQQFRLYYDQQKPIGPVAQATNRKRVLWASVSDEVAERLAQGTNKLRPQDWKSGDKLWVVEVIAPFGGSEEMVKDLKEKVFPQREIRFLAVKEGKQEVMVL